MGKFFLGVIITLIVLILGGLGFALLGFMPTRANVEPPHIERHLAMGAIDASMDRHAPHAVNPLTPTDQDLEDGMKIYTMNCALCHGRPRPQTRRIGRQFLSAASQSDFRSARRSRVAHLLHHPHRHPLHRHARLGRASSPTSRSGSSRPSSPTWTNFPLPSRNTGRPASTWLPKPPTKKRTTRKKRRHGNETTRGLGGFSETEV